MHSQKKQKKNDLKVCSLEKTKIMDGDGVETNCKHLFKVSSSWLWELRQAVGEVSGDFSTGLC